MSLEATFGSGFLFELGLARSWAAQWPGCCVCALPHGNVAVGWTPAKASLHLPPLGQGNWGSCQRTREVQVRAKG